MRKPTSFVKGDPRINRKGAPKRDWTWSGELQKAVEKAENTGKRVKQIVAEALIKQARKGNIHATKELMNRMDGMPQQSTDITTGGKPLPTPIYGSKSKV